MSGMVPWLIQTCDPSNLGGEVERYVDAGVRHKSGITHKDFLRSFLRVGRELAYATRDDSWGEFEKEFTIIVSRMARAEQRLRQVDPKFFED